MLSEQREIEYSRVVSSERSSSRSMTGVSGKWLCRSSVSQVIRLISERERNGV